MKKSIGAKTILFPTPVLIVGTYNENDKPNFMNAAWGGICCSSPPCVTVSLREATYSYNSILTNKAYTLSIPSVKYASEADYFGLVSGKDIDKTKVTKITVEKSDLVNAPYIKEFPVILECKLVNDYKIGLHTMFVGEILDVKAEESVLGDKGYPDIEKVQPLLFDSAHRRYFSVGEFAGSAFNIGKKFQ